MTNFVTLESNENKVRLNNMYNTGIFIGFAWILFHFTIVFFFGLFLESILLVGIFLGVGNLTALALDIPIGALQKYIKPKNFIIIGAIFMIIACLIFLKFIYFEDISSLLPGGNSALEKTTYFGLVFLNSSLNIILLILASIFYGIIKESFDVTILSYIFNNSTPGEYASILSKYNIYNGGGAMIGLIFSGILLSFNIKIAIIIFILILIGFLIFILKYFDNKDKTLEFGEIKKIKLDVLKNDLLSKKDEIIGQINTKKLIELSRTSKVILLKPIEIKKQINFKEVYDSSIASFNTFYVILTKIPRNIFILWFLCLIMIYGFWDTFVATYLIEFLKKIIGLNADEFVVKQTMGLFTGYVLLGLLIIPAFGFQDFFIKLSKKIGVFKVIIFGNILSAISLILFGLTDKLYFVLLFGIINSIGYAATMPLAQSFFSGLYNEEYAKKFNLKEIDSTVSRAPLKVVLNGANVVGIILGALIVKIFGFNLFFIIFGLFIFSFFIFSMTKMKKELILFSKESLKKEESKDIDFM